MPKTLNVLIYFARFVCDLLFNQIVMYTMANRCSDTIPYTVCLSLRRKIYYHKLLTLIVAPLLHPSPIDKVTPPRTVKSWTHPYSAKRAFHLFTIMRLTLLPLSKRVRCSEILVLLFILFHKFTRKGFGMRYWCFFPFRT